MENGVQLRSGDEDIIFLAVDKTQRSVSDYTITLHKMDGQNSIEDLLRIGLLGLEELQNLIVELKKQNLLSSPRNAYNNPIALCFHGDKALENILHATLQEHFSTIEYVSEKDAHLVICAVEKPNLGLLETVNQNAVKIKKPALFIDLSHGLHATIGPFYIPDEGPCYHCLHTRLLQNTATYPEQIAYDQFQRQNNDVKSYGPLPAFRQIVCGIVAIEILAFFTKHQSLRSLRGAIVIDFTNFNTWREQVWQIPWCKICGA
jgi:bacteriocin biosynthesis cyclodehydratase domain-containing protein